jgi:putative hydrolase of the HAD superfamily
MSAQSPITCIFTDIGGVLGTNGWDHSMRQQAAKQFGLDYAEMDERNHLTFDTYEVGKLSLDEYLTRVVFYRPRTFSREDFVRFMFEQSQPYQSMIDLVCRLKERHRLKVAVVSNEGRELTMYRIPKFKLGEFVDFYIVSSFVHFRKPDADIFRVALDIAQVPPEQVAYIEDRPMFVDVACGLGVSGIHHISVEQTRSELAALGLPLTD